VPRQHIKLATSTHQWLACNYPTRPSRCHSISLATTEALPEIDIIESLEQRNTRKKTKKLQHEEARLSHPHALRFRHLLLSSGPSTCPLRTTKLISNSHKPQSPKPFSISLFDLSSSSHIFTNTIENSFRLLSEFCSTRAISRSERRGCIYPMSTLSNTRLSASLRRSSPT
jgi:hypothetical protein